MVMSSRAGTIMRINSRDAFIVYFFWYRVGGVGLPKALPTFTYIKAVLSTHLLVSLIVNVPFLFS